jgi:hypothetical protein
VSDDLAVKRHSTKVIYGLKQAGRAWQEVATIVKKRLVCMGGNMSEADKCLYLKNKLFWTYFTLMIRLIATTTIAGCYQVINGLKEHWFVRVIGEPNMFLGREIVRRGGAHTLRICQLFFNSKIVKEFGLSSVNPRKLLLAQSADLKPIHRSW